MRDLLVLCEAAAETATVAVALAAADGKPPAEIMILPAGEMETVEGDPRGPWRNADPAAIIAASMTGRDLPINFNHAREGASAAAAGWIKRLFERAGAIWAAVEWTPRGIEALRNREFRFISPEFTHAPDGTVRRIAAAGLVNLPALVDMPALAAAAIGAAESGNGNWPEALALLGIAPNEPPGRVMERLLEELTVAYQLPDGTDWPAAIEALTAARRAEARALGLEETASAADLAVARRVQAQLGGGPTGTVAAAVAAGKITPAARQEAETLAAVNP